MYEFMFLLIGVVVLVGCYGVVICGFDLIFNGVS